MGFPQRENTRSADAGVRRCMIPRAPERRAGDLIKSSREYAEFKNKLEARNAPEPKTVYTDDLSRLIVFFILFVLFIIGFVITEYGKNPKRMLSGAIERTIHSRYTASIEGRTTVGDSLIADYRSRETYDPKSGVSEFFSGGTAKPPRTSLELLGSVLATTSVREIKRQDMFGRPTQHFTGTVPKNPKSDTGGAGASFEAWVDFRDHTIVRLSVTTVRRNVTVSARGDSLSAATYLTIRFTR
jgi:hypothetical protein